MTVELPPGLNPDMLARAARSLRATFNEKEYAPVAR